MPLLRELSLARIVAQRLTWPLAGPVEVVHHLGCVQGQGLPGALTSVALRTRERGLQPVVETFGPRSPAVDPAVLRQGIAGEVNRRRLFLNAWVDGRVVGSAQARTMLDDDPVHSYADIGVLPAWRGHGIGRQLVQEVLAGSPSMDRVGWTSGWQTTRSTSGWVCRAVHCCRASASGGTRRPS